MKKAVAVLLAAASMLGGVSAQANSYDPATNRLTIDSIQVGNTIYTGVVVTVGSVVSVGGQQTVSPVSDACSASNFSTAKMSAIQPKMTLEQVNQAIGCRYTPGRTVRMSALTIYSWYAVSGTSSYLIQVYFDAATETVTTTLGEAYKVSSGF